MKIENDSQIKLIESSAVLLFSFGYLSYLYLNFDSDDAPQTFACLEKLN